MVGWGFACDLRHGASFWSLQPSHHHEVLHSGRFRSLDKRDGAFTVYLLHILERAKEVAFWRANGRHDLQMQRQSALPPACSNH